MACFALIALPNLAVIDRLWQVWAMPAGAAPGLLAALMLAWLAASLLLAPRLALALASRLRAQPRRQAMIAAIAVGLALLTTAFVYPVVDSGRLGFHSDRDEALDVGARELLAARNPYRCRVLSGEHRGCHDEGNPIGPLAGGLLLAAPFVLTTGSSAFQTVAWFALGWFVALRRRHRAHAAVAIAISACVFSPIVFAELASGGDLLANALAVSLLAGAWTARAQPDRAAWGLALLLGVALAWRSHFLLVVPLLAVWQARRWGWRPALRQLCAVGAVFVALTLPFLLATPQDFGPLQVQQKLRDAGGPFGQTVALTISAAVALGAAALMRSRATMLFGCAVALALPPLFAVTFESWAQGRFAPAFYGWYTLGASGFALLAGYEWLAAQQLGAAAGVPAAAPLPAAAGAGYIGSTSSRRYAGR